MPNVKRFSIDVDHPVQQTKDLIAVHNLDEEKLLADINELGGFPAPSIAIIRQGMEHNGYGDISVLFEKNTIDSERSKNNRVYGGDAWTPTFPTVEYDINDDVFYKAREKFKALKAYSTPDIDFEISGFTDSRDAVPVKITVKEFDNVYSKNGVYVMMNLPKIKRQSHTRT